MPDSSMNVLDRFRHGDPDAFETLFREHQAPVYRWILRIVRNRATAEELVVEAFWRIYRGHARFEPSRGFAPWARRIATNTALDWLRVHRNEDAQSVALEDGYSAAQPGDPGASLEMRAKIAQAFARLPPRLRIAAVLAVVEEQPHKEVAESLGISVAAVKLRVFRALRKLRKDLERQGITP